MNDARIKSVAETAIKQARTAYGVGWERISHDARVGASVRFAISAFASYAPDAPASDVAKVFHLISKRVGIA